jgi:hypothetical protein
VKTIEHLNKVIAVFQRLKKYFTKETNDKIHIITHNIKEITKEQKNYLIEIKTQIDLLINKLSGLKELGFQSFKDVEKTIDLFLKYKIDLNFLSHLNTDETKILIDNINTSLDEVINKAGILQGEINKQKDGIQCTIKKYKKEINDFLKYAGYKYSVDIKLDKDEKYRMKLKHNDLDEMIGKADSYLSFGERNAFSLILFMYETLKNNSDLIILDDPISSFDKNKKFAILNILFRGKGSFQDKTVLLLTHDFEPIIDTLINLPHKFSKKPYVTFLSINNGELKEIEIEKKDIKSFMEIAIDNISKLDEDINKLVYLRRLYEINRDKTEAYNLISNIFHKREVPIIKESYDQNSSNMTKEEIKIAEREIKSMIPNFSYENIIKVVLDSNKMVELYEKSKNNYEKLQIYRIIFNKNHDNEVIKKFINETFHMENDYILQLNPCKYECIPYYIIDECDKDIENLKKDKKLVNLNQELNFIVTNQPQTKINHS